MINGEQITRARQLVGWSPSILQQRARRMTTAAIKRAEEGDETALTAEQLIAIEAAFARVRYQCTSLGCGVRGCLTLRGHCWSAGAGRADHSRVACEEQSAQTSASWLTPVVEWIDPVLRGDV